VPAVKTEVAAAAEVAPEAMLEAAPEAASEAVEAVTSPPAAQEPSVESSNGAEPMATC
jgi:hypothetical protein